MSRIDDVRKKYGITQPNRIEDVKKKYGIGDTVTRRSVSQSSGVFSAPETFTTNRAEPVKEAAPEVVAGTGLGLGMTLPTRQQATGALADVSKQMHEDATEGLNQLKKDKRAAAWDPSSRNPESENFKTSEDWDKERESLEGARDTAAKNYYGFAGQDAVNKVLGTKGASGVFSSAVEAAVTANDLLDKYRNGGWNPEAATAMKNATEAQGRAVDILVSYGVDKATAERAIEYQAGLVRQGKAAARAQETEEWAKEHKGLASVISVATNPTQGLDYLNALARNHGHNSTKDLESYRPITGADFQNTAYTEALRSGASSELGTVGKFLYDTGMSMVDSFVLANTVGPLTGVLLGAGAASSSAKNALDRGATNKQALAVGFAAGAAEMLFESLSVERLLKIQNVDTAKQYLKSFLQQGVTEGSEEVFTEIANILTDTAIMGQNSNFEAAVKAYQKEGLSEEAAMRKAYLDSLVQVGLAAAGGFLSGAVMGGAQATPSYVYNKAYQNYLEKNLNTNQINILSVAQEFSADSETRKLADQISTAINDAAENDRKVEISPDQWGRLMRSMEAERDQFGPADPGAVDKALHPNEDTLTATAQAFIDAGADAKTANTKGALLERLRSGDSSLSNEELRALDLNSPATRAVFKSLLGVELPGVTDGHVLNRAALDAARSIAAQRTAQVEQQAAQQAVAEAVQEAEVRGSEAERNLEAEAARMVQEKAAQMSKPAQTADAQETQNPATETAAGEESRASVGEIAPETSVAPEAAKTPQRGSAKSLLDYVTRVNQSNADVRQRTQETTVKVLNSNLKALGATATIEVKNLGQDGPAAQWNSDGRIELNADVLDKDGGYRHASQHAIVYTLTHELFHEASSKQGGESSQWTKAQANELIEFGKSRVGEEKWAARVESMRNAQISAMMRDGKTREEAEARLTEDYLNEELAADVLRDVFASQGKLNLFAKEHRSTLTKIRDWLQKKFDALLGRPDAGNHELVQEMNRIIKNVNEALTKTVERGTDKAETTTQEAKYSAEGREETDTRAGDDYGRSREPGPDPRAESRGRGRNNRENNASLEEDDLRLIGDVGLWAIAAVRTPVTGSGAQLGQDFARDHQVRTYVLDDQVMLDNGHKVGFTRNGAIFLSDKIPPESGESVAKHELIHAMKQLEFDPYNRFLMGVEDQLIPGKLLNSMLQATMEHVRKTKPELTTTDPADLHDLSLELQKHIWDEFTAIAYGTWANDPEASAEGFGLAFSDPVGFMSELDALLEAFKARDTSLDWKFSVPTLADTNTEEFRQWFNDDSGELTNPDGTPKFLMRGTSLSGPTKFRDYRKSYSPGIFLTPDLYAAKNYAMAKTTQYGAPEFIPRHLTTWNEAFQWVDDGGLGNFVSLEREGPEWVFAKRNPIFPTRWDDVATYPNTQEGLEKFNAEYGDLMRNVVFKDGRSVNPGYMRGYATATKTKVIDAQGRIWLNVDDKWSKTDDLVREAWDEGYDCVVIKNVQDGGEEIGVGFDENDNYVTQQKPIDVIVVKDSGQFKSAYNTGAFDRKNPDVRYSPNKLNFEPDDGMIDGQEEVRPNDRERAVYSGLVGDYKGGQSRPIPEGAVRNPEGDNRGQVRYRELTESQRARVQRILIPAAEESPEWRKIIRQFSLDEAAEIVYDWAVSGDPRVEGMKRQIPGFSEAVGRALEEVTAVPNSAVDHTEDALNYFGKTYSWDETGYLLKDGSQLDFSGKKFGGPKGGRSIDHREVGDAIGLDYGGDSYGGAMVQFMREGNIRITPENNGINLSVAPTVKQQEKLERYIERAHGEVLLDIDDAEGNTVASVEYPKWTKPSRILGDIRRYFADGVAPRVSEFEQFRYSPNTDYQTGGNTGNVNPETGFRRGSVADSFMRIWNTGAQDEAINTLEYILTRLAELEAEAQERNLRDLRAAVLKPRVTEEIAERNRRHIERLIERYGMIPQTGGAQQEVRLPEQIDDQTYVAGAAQTIMAHEVTNELLADELVQDILAGNAGVTYARIGDRETLKQVDDEFERQGVAGFMRQWKNKVNGGEGMTKLDIARAEKLYVELAGAKEFTDEGIRDILNLVAEISAAGTQAGQTVQAMTLLKKMTPTGQLYYIQKAVDRLNRSPSQKSPITINEQLAKQLAEAKTISEINAAVDAIITDIAQQVPVSLADKWNTWRYFAMLGNPRTHIRNLLGNAIFAPARLAKNVIGTGLERAILRGERADQRTKAIVSSKELRDFAEQDAEEMKDILRGGGKYNTSDMIRDKRIIFKKAPWLNTATQKNSELLEMEDWVFLRSSYQSALAGFLSARGITDVNDLLDTNEGRKTLNEAREYAVREAQRATYRDMSKLASMLNSGKRNLPKPLGWLLEGIVPFTKTPVNIVKRGFEYSPLGIVKTIYDAANRGVAKVQREHGKTVKRDTLSAAEVIDELAANLTGTGVAVLGVLLSRLGMLTAGLGEDDEDKFKELYGDQAYSLNIPGVGSYTIDWMAPVALPLFVGAEIYNTLTEDYGDPSPSEIVDAVADGMTTILEPMLSLSMLDGVNEALSANKFGDSEDAIWNVLSAALGSYVSQGIPTALGQVARTIDPNRRTTFTEKGEGKVNSQLQRFWQSSVQGKVPVYQNDKLAYVDAWGRTDTTGNVLLRAFENFISPGYINSSRKTGVETELERLAAAEKDTSVMPDRAAKYFSVNKETYAMSKDEYEEHLIDRGQTSYRLVSDFINDPAYQQMSDKDRVAVIRDIYEYAKQTACYHTNSEYDLDTWVESVDAYVRNGGDAVEYITMRHMSDGDPSELAYGRSDLSASEMGTLVLGDTSSSQRAPKTFADPIHSGYEYELNDAQRAEYTEMYDAMFNEEFADLYESTKYRNADAEKRKELIGDLRADVAKDVKKAIAKLLRQQGIKSTKK